jgi:16S rRNA (adenine1518-N6/adenine1519-N6)-dimethyltransferase
MATGDEPKAHKSLGQHWLADQTILKAIADLADISKSDTILEIGPGTGRLTKLLSSKANKVIAIELDTSLIKKLTTLNLSNVQIVNEDILNYDLSGLGKYKLVANIPYYLTGKIIKLISETAYRPELVVLLVQKEIADRLAAKPGDMSILGLTCQFYWDVQKGPLVTPDKFIPPPKVTSQIVKLTPKAITLSGPEVQELLRLIKIAFSSKRKTILNNVSSGYRQDKETVKNILLDAGIDATRRPQTLSLQEWQELLIRLNTSGCQR